MPKEILEQLFDSPVKVKLLKLFFRNPDQSFELKEIVRKIKSDSSSSRRQIKKLESIGLINSRIKNRKKVYFINPDFVFYGELKSLVLKSSPASKEKILKRLKMLGRINLAILSGIFVNAENTRVDLLVVGDNIKKKKLSSFLRDLEAEVGREIDYVILSTEEFKYRYDMFDRFIRDVLEKPHEKLINKLKV
jgi:predicted transcriptional regulator